MAHKRITQFNQQRKGEASQESGILQRTAIRSVSDAEVQSTDKEAQPLSNSAFSKDFSRVPISTTKSQSIIGSIVQQYNRNNTIQRAAPTGQLVQRTNSENENSSQTDTIQRFQASIGGNNLKECKKKLEERFPDNGPLFSDTQLEQIRSMSNDESTTTIKWLQEVGIGKYQEAQKYLEKEPPNFEDWLNLTLGKRLLITTLAWNKGRGDSNNSPSPAYSLARKMMIKKGGLKEQEQKSLIEDENKDIRNSFLKTFQTEKNEEFDDKQNNMAIAASNILTKIFLILQSGLQIYNKQKSKHIDYKDGDVARALAHGGRVNIRIPALQEGENPKALMEWIGITKEGELADTVFKRKFATHGTKITKNKGDKRGKFEETGGRIVAVKNYLKPNVELLGQNQAAGGLGNLDINGNIILVDGAHGHLFIGFNSPTKDRDGSLQIGLETTAPGANSLVGYVHNWRSTEKTANPESSYHGHKTDKIGEGKLKNNQRYIDLKRYEKGEGQKWLDYLKKVEEDWNEILKINKEQAFEELIGNRKYFGYDNEGNLKRQSEES